MNTDLEQYLMSDINPNKYKLGISYLFAEFNPQELLKMNQLINMPHQETSQNFIEPCPSS